MTVKLHELGYTLAVTDADGDTFEYDDVIDFGLVHSSKREQPAAIRVEVEDHSHLIFEPLPQSLHLERNQ